MLTEIQDAVINVFKRTHRQVEARDAAGIDPTKIMNSPTILVAIDKVDIKPLNARQNVYSATAVLDVFVCFKNVRGETSRRSGIYPLLIGVIQKLAGQTLGLNIKPLVPTDINNVTRSEDSDDGFAVFRVAFTTGFDLRLDLDGCAAAPDLLAVGLNYFLQEPVDDGKADASDVLNIPH